jgi:hypothetical protein
MELPPVDEDLASLIHRNFSHVARHLRAHPAFKEAKDTEHVFRDHLKSLADVEADQMKPRSPSI